MDRRNSEGVSGTGLWLNVRRGTLVIVGWPALLIAGTLVVARLVLGVTGGMPAVSLRPEVHHGPGAASSVGHEGSRPTIAPAE